MNACKPIYTGPGSVAAFFATFNNGGITADFPDRRGRYSKVVLINYQASGVKQFRQGKITTFDYDSEISRSRIKSIEVLSTAQMLLVPTQPVKDSPQSEFNDMVLVLKDKCNNIVCTTPLSNLCRALNGNKATFFDLVDIDWGACGVIGTAAASITSANALAFRVSFE